MRKGTGVGLILAGLFLAVAAWFTIAGGQFWILKPKEKFISAWNDDLILLEKSKKLPAQWANIRDVTLRTDNSPAQDWISGVTPPIQTNPNGTFNLDVFIVHWLEGYRYGALVTYTLVDTRNNNNTVWELSRTFKLGIVY